MVRRVGVKTPPNIPYFLSLSVGVASSDDGAIFSSTSAGAESAMAETATIDFETQYPS
jgi:hypothetical protein